MCGDICLIEEPQSGEKMGYKTVFTVQIFFQLIFLSPFLQALIPTIHFRRVPVSFPFSKRKIMMSILRTLFGVRPRSSPYERTPEGKLARDLTPTPQPKFTPKTFQRSSKICVPMDVFPSSSSSCNLFRSLALLGLIW